MRVINLASGSKGNCTLIENEETSILVDCGLPITEIENRIIGAGSDPSKISAIFVTHTHVDHIRSLTRFSKKYKTKVFATDPNWIEGKLSAVGSPNRRFVKPGEEINYFGFKIVAFSVSHDAISTVGYRIFCGTKSVSILTDVVIVAHNAIFFTYVPLTVVGFAFKIVLTKASKFSNRSSSLKETLPITP